MSRNKPKDPRGRHIRVYCDLLNSPAYRVLSVHAKALFFDMREQVTGTNNGNLSATLSNLKHKGWKSSQTLSKALYELRVMGFIAVTREGGLKQGSRICTLYRFTDLEVYEQSKVGVLFCKATHDYRKYTTLREVEQALKNGIEELRHTGRKKQVSKKNPPVPVLNCTSSSREPIARFTNSVSEQGENLPVQYENRENLAKSRWKSA